MHNLGKLKVGRRVESARPSGRIDLDTTLQYGYASGHPALHSLIKKLVTTVYFPLIPYKGGPSVIISGGSADGLAKVYDVFLNAWDEGVHRIEDREGLLVEEFVYPPAIAQARSRNPNIVAVKMDAEGALAYGDGSLLDVLSKWDDSKGKRPHILYTVP